MKPIDRRQLLRRLAALAAVAPGLPVLRLAGAAPPSLLKMRISRGEAIPIRVPWAERVREAAVREWARENMDVPDSRYTLIRLHTDEGLTGIGVGGSQATLDRMIGHSPWEYVLDDSIGGVLMAVYDVIGQAMGLPISKLLAARPRTRIVQTWWSLSYEPELLASEAKLGASLGFRVHKVKARPWRDPVAQAAALCAAVPSDYRVWVDANFFWGSVGRTIHFCRKLAEFPNYFGVESPIARGDLEGFRRLRGRIPLQLAEHLGVIDTMTAIREGLLEAFIVTGPFGRTMLRLDAMARLFGKQLWVENSCWTGIGQVFQAHQAAAFPGVAYTIGCAHMAEDDLVKEPFTMRDGFYHLPSRPGLGVTLDENAVEKYRAA